MRFAVILLALSAFASEPWKRHTIDASSRGADGVRLAGLDIVTGWEEGGVVRVYRYPGPERVRSLWPAETVGKVGDPEDAVFVDLDGDGTLDVVSASEGRTRKLTVHWGPDWKSEPIPASVGMMQWMFSTPMDMDGKRGIDLVSAGKNEGAALGWWESPPNPRKLSDWRWHPLRPVGWIMSILSVDMDGDGDLDIVFSDRRGAQSGVAWLENPGWNEHNVGAGGREVMFITVADLDGDGLDDILSAVKPREIHWHRRLDASGKHWKTEVIPMPADTGTAKAVRVADLDGDGKPEIIFSCEQTPAGSSGVMYMKRYGDEWRAFPISGSPGVKYDLIEVADLDKDGDLDVITCEENTNLGVIWFENPFQGASGSQ